LWLPLECNLFKSNEELSAEDRLRMSVVNRDLLAFAVRFQRFTRGWEWGYGALDGTAKFGSNRTKVRKVS